MNNKNKIYNIDFLDINKFKIEFKKWFKLCFSNIDFFMKNKDSELYSLNGLCVFINYDEQPDYSLNEITIYIVNHENIKDIRVSFDTKDNKKSIVLKLDNFKKQLVKNNLISNGIYY